MSQMIRLLELKEIMVEIYESGHIIIRDISDRQVDYFLKPDESKWLYKTLEAVYAKEPSKEAQDAQS